MKTSKNKKPTTIVVGFVHPIDLFSNQILDMFKKLVAQNL